MFITGIYIMIIGMLTVFLFLCLLILLMQVNYLILKAVNKFMPEEPEEQDEMQEIAAVLTAIKAYVKG